MSEAFTLETVPPPEVDFTLLQEANHRIANNLSLIASMVQMTAHHLNEGPESLDREHVRGLLREVAGKVVSVGHLHRHLANMPMGGGRIDLAGYLLDHWNVLRSSLDLDTRLTLIPNLSGGCEISSDQAQAIALIVTEFTMNTLKHSHPTGVAVIMSLQCACEPDGTITITVSDDGIGLPANVNPKSGGGVGLKLMRTLAARLHAKMSLRTDSLGVTLTLVIPPSSN